MVWAVSSYGLSVIQSENYSQIWVLFSRRKPPVKNNTWQSSVYVNLQIRDQFAVIADEVYEVSKRQSQVERVPAKVYENFIDLALNMHDVTKAL